MRMKAKRQLRLWEVLPKGAKIRKTIHCGGDSVTTMLPMTDTAIAKLSKIGRQHELAGTHKCQRMLQGLRQCRVTLLWRSFEKTGMLMRADKQCEDKICPEGLTESYKFHEALNPQPPRSGVMPSSRWEGGAQRKTKVILTVNEEMEVEKLGMHFGEVGTPPHTLYVVAVSSSSPGARAGFVEGDQVVSADGKPMTCLQDFKNVYNTKDVDCDEITIEFQLRSLPSDEEAQIPTQNVQYPRQIDFEDSDLYTDDPEEACCEGNTSQNPSVEQLVVTSEDDDHPMRKLRYNLRSLRINPTEP